MMILHGIWLTLLASKLVLGHSPPSQGRDYDFKILNCVLDKDAKSYVPRNDIKLTKVSKTESSMSGTCTLAKNIPITAIIEVLGYQKNGRSYAKDHTFNVTRPICEFMANDKMMYPRLTQCSNFPRTCPIMAQDFKVDNYCIKNEDLPEKVQGEFWLIVITGYEDKTTMSPKLFQSKCEVHFDKTNSKKKKQKSKGR